jgi:predicted nucleic acid-binding Zn finger protein
MTTYTILVKFNDGSSKCIKSFYLENDAVIQFGKIVEEEVKKFDKHIDAYVYLGESGKSIVYDEYFSCDREIEFFPVGFEIIEHEIDDSIS